MPELNHDMEDLFKRAAESYPLKPMTDWESIGQKLDAALPQVVQKETRKKRWLFWFLFLFLASAIYFTIDRLLVGSVQSVPERNAKANNQAAVGDKSAELSYQFKSNESPAVDENPVFGQLTTTSDKNKKGRSNVDHEEKPVSDQWTPVNGGIFNKQFVAQQQLASLKNKSNFIPGIPPSSFYPITHPASDAIIDSLNNGTITETAQPKIQSGLKKKSKFYFGITVGPAVNSVKSFGYSKAIEGGFFAGVQFNNRFSAEAALLYTVNDYEARSKHFDKKEISGMLTGGRELNEVHGSNKLIEVPLSIRYKFSRGTKSFYTGAGISSYIMTRESNWYLTTLNGNNEMLYGDYDKKKVYLASAIILSAGYQLPLGQKNRIRLEPYIQLPLRGIGVGKIRIMSTGLQVGISRTKQ